MIERGVKRLLPVRTYRCRSCGWRGWISNRRVHRRQPLKKVLLFYFFVIVISLLAAMFLKNTF